MKWILVIAIGISSPAVAVPTYLSCALTDKLPVSTFAVVADEEKQGVTLTIGDTGAVERLPALFTPTTVEFQKNISPAVISYLINRVDLSFQRTVAIEGQRTLGTNHGKCTVQTAPSRAF